MPKLTTGDSALTTEEVREALKRWHDLAALSKTRFSQWRLIQIELRQPEAPPIAEVVREILLDALRQLPSGKPQQTNDLNQSLVYREYILNQSVTDICKAAAIGRSTFFRNRDRELDELCVILDRMAAALTENDKQSELSLTRLIITSTTPPVPVFVGRENEMRSARAALTGGTSGALLAITGLPGAGKTTFVAALSEDSAVRNAYPDGILWASIGPTRDVSHCLVEWLVALGLDEPDLRTAPIDRQRQEIRKALAGRRVLTILDDIWHVDDAQALMLGSHGAAYVFTTRQQPIAYHFTTNVLALPDFQTEESMALLQWYLPEDILSQARIHPNLLAIADRLNGLPLGVSVAAHNLRWLARTGQPRRFADYVEQHLAKDAQNALADRVMASVQLLDNKLIMALASLSLFQPKPNTFSESLGCAITGCDVTLLDVLVDIGLVESQNGRYTLHQAIAEIVAHLPADPDAPLRLAEYCTNVLAQSETGFMAQDVMNLDSALQTAEKLGRDDLYTGIATRVVWLFENTGRLDVLEHALHTAMGKSTSTTQWALITVHLARTMWLRERSDIALQMLWDAGDIAAATNDPVLVGIASRILADVSFERDDLVNAVVHIHRAGSAWDAPESAKSKARAEAAALRNYMLNPRFDALRTMLARALPVGIAERVASEQLMLGVTGKAWLDFLTGDTNAGLIQLVRALAMSEERSHRIPALFALGTLAWASAVMGDYDKARQYGERAVYAPDRDRLPDFVVLAYSALGMTALAQGNTREALSVLRDGLDYSEAQGADAMGAGLHATLAQLYLAEGNLPEAWAHSETGYSHAKAWRFTLVSVNCLSMMGAVACRRQDYDRARQHFIHALREGRLDAPKANPWVNTYYRQHYAHFFLASGNTAEAIVQYNKAIDIAKALNAGEYTGQALFGLATAQVASGDKGVAKATALESLSVLRGIGHVGADAVSRWLQQIE